MTRPRPGFGSSLRLRLAVAMLAWIAAGLVVIGFSTSALFRRHVEAQFHEELKIHLVELANLTRLAPDGRPVLDRPLSDPRYGMLRSGFYWQVERAGGQVLLSDSVPAAASASSGSARALDPSLAHQPAIVHRMAMGPTGPTMTYGFARPAPDGGPELHFLIATDERVLNEVISSFNQSLWRWLTLLAVGLFGTGTFVIIYALGPLDRLGQAIASVRDGSARRMEGSWPAEISPLVEDLNGLLDANDAMVARARLEAGNLAHGLRTSLAILADEAETLSARSSEPVANTILEQSRLMARQLDWHLARVRAGARPHASTTLPTALVPIVRAMQRLHAGRGIDLIMTPGAALVVAMDEEDFAEILSNLVDNAGKWARHQVLIGWRAEGRDALVTIMDDGPGIPEAARVQAFEAGKRLDEEVAGHGLGLAIAQDLARQHCAEVILSERDDGASGLVATLRVPLAAPERTGQEEP